MTVLYIMVHAGLYTGLLPPDVHPVWLRLPLLHTRSWVGESLEIHEKIQPESIQGKEYPDTEGRQHLYQLLVLTNSDPMFDGIHR